MFSLGFYPRILKPSRITLNSATLIDNIFMNKTGLKTKSGLLLTDITDHLPIFVVIEIENNQKIKKNETMNSLFREKTPSAIEAMKDDLMQYDWQEIYVDDVNDSYSTFLDLFMRIYDFYCPLKTHKKKILTKSKPWITRGLENACRKKNKLYRDFIKNKTEENETKYKTYKNKLISMLRKQKRSYYDKLLQRYVKDIRSTWKVINNVMEKKKDNCFPNYIKKDNVTIEDKQEIVNEFNNFFVNVGAKLAEKIPVVSDMKSKIDCNMNTMFLSGVSPSDVLEVVHQMKNKKSTDCHGIDMSLIKEVIHSILEPLTYICNKSFSSGVVPDLMKVAKVVPIHKNGNKETVSNYRPVSLLPQFSQILEKLFAVRLDAFLSKYDLLNESQYGFRSNCSTAHAVMEFVENVATAIDQKLNTIAVFVDLSKAFDTIDHSLLLQKCEYYGLRGKTHHWLRSYLENRVQYVTINNTDSNLENIFCGLPQGSVLGPKLFSIYINDIFLMSKKLKFIMFADDTNMFCSGQNIVELLNVVEQEFNLVKKWFDFNKLSLNENKTKFMIFSGNRKVENVKLYLNKVEIQCVKEIKFLG
uniref:Reverse transcriptase domain-containing protein n=1 Tax=Oryzias melastigma TaxID=30732 RepID=A0A3B3BUC2_ORYME